MRKATCIFALFLLAAVLASCAPSDINVKGTKYSLDEPTLLLHNRGLTDGDVKNLRNAKNLEFLALADNNLTSLGFLKDLTTLQTLDIGGNDVTDITDLQNLVNLTTLIIRDNDIADLSVLAKLPKLQSLTFSVTAETDITPVKGLTSLTYLECVGLGEAQRAELVEALPTTAKKFE
ncbi:MAG: leucine-rich repeat domain-containing protein [Oscillospiraceae bacterium]|jgi:hypothetical protein|nr:leucine-rich repeat domain-containing protein [Oscillospiraceae bacterium]